MCTFGFLLLNSIVAFQFVEDGTPASIWGFRIFGATIFVLTMIVSLLSFMGLLGSAGAIIVHILYFIYPAICIAIYGISQTVLTMHSSGDKWPIGIQILLTIRCYFHCIQFFHRICPNNVCVFK
jgi:hypothetical protein